MASGFDDLFELRNNYYIGAFTQALEEVQALDILEEPSARLQRDVFMYRTYIAQGNYKIVLDEIKPNSPPEFEALRMYAMYLESSDQDLKEEIIATINAWKSNKSMLKPQSIAIFASMLIGEGKLEDAWGMCECDDSSSVEVATLKIFILIKLNRPAQAQTSVKALMKTDEDHVLTQLSLAWVSLFGDERSIDDAYEIFLECIEKYSRTPTLVNGCAVCKMAQHKFAEAERILVELYAKHPTDPLTLINLISVMQRLDKPAEAFQRSLSVLRTAAPMHPWLMSFDQLNEDFDVEAGKYSASVGDDE